jgi:hypothetical protein
VSNTRKRIFLSAIVLAATLCSLSAWAAEPYLIDSVALPASPAIAQSLRAALNPQGSLLYTYSNGLREPICEIFLVKAVSGQAAKTVAGQASASDSAAPAMHYPNLSPGSLIGVIHLLREATEDYYVDSHDQKLKPGYYTMRYAVLPAGTYANGPVMGEFVVLSKAHGDTDPARTVPAKELLKHGQWVSGTSLPACMQLVPVDPKSKQSPAVIEDGQGVGTFQVTLHLAPEKGASSSELDLAMVLLTPAPHPEGS